MSKLAHSNEETMLEIDIDRAIENGDWHQIGISPMPVIMCEESVKTGIWDGDKLQWTGRCSYQAKYLTADGGRVCPFHARRYVHEYLSK